MFAIGSVKEDFLGSVSLIIVQKRTYTITELFEPRRFDFPRQQNRLSHLYPLVAHENLRYGLDFDVCADE